MASVEKTTDKKKRFRRVEKNGDDQVGQLEVEMKVGSRSASTTTYPEVVAGSDVQFRENLKAQASPKITTVRDLRQVLLQHLVDLNCQVTPQKVTKGTFQDAERLFGADLKEKVTLWQPGQLTGPIQLLQFDPNFLSAGVLCRHPSCHNRNPNAETEGNKRDLYLCPTHKEELKTQIERVLAKNQVIRGACSMNIKDHEQGDLKEYTSLISLLGAVYFAEEKSSGFLGVKSTIIQEAILNVRNFLIITSTVLNPDINNLGLALPPVLGILRLLMESPGCTMLSLLGLLYVLKEVMGLILSSFGVIYSWIFKRVATSDALIGAGVIGCIGGFFTVVTQGEALQVAAGVAAGVVSGFLLGRGYSKQKEQLRKQKIKTNYNLERKPVQARMLVAMQSHLIHLSDVNCSIISLYEIDS